MGAAPPSALREFGNAEATVDVKDILPAIRGGWWLLMLGLLLGVGGAGAITWQATPMYTSTTQLFVSTTGTSDATTALQGNMFTQQRMASYVQLLTGPKLAERVTTALSLDESPAELSASIAATAMPETVLLNATVTRPSPVEARDIAQTLGEHFSQMVTELETLESGTASAVKVTITAPPQIADEPASPRPVRSVLIGALLGLFAGIGAALVRARLDNTVKTPESVQQIAGAGVVGALVEDGAVQQGPATDEDSYSETAEAYRQIRTNLQFIDVDNPAKVIVVTSSLPGEGKTTVAVNLAVVLAQSGARVALIEADMRRPRVTRYLGMISGAGLSNVLSGAAYLDDVLQPYGDGQLSVMAAGPMPPYPSEMLGSQQMRGLLDALREQYDYVILDAPPLLPVTDGAVLSVAADGAIVVARHGVTTRAQLQQATSDLRRIDARLLGVVLNRIPAKAASGYGYGYQYSYAAVAETEDPRGARRTMPVHTTTFAPIRDDDRPLHYTSR